MWKLWVLLICICLIPCLWRFNHHIWTMESFSSWMLPLGCDKINLLESISKLTTSLDKIMYGPLTLFVNMCPYLLKYVYILSYPISIYFSRNSMHLQTKLYSTWTSLNPLSKIDSALGLFESIQLSLTPKTIVVSP